MDKIYIPIGCDCTPAQKLKELGVRKYALPFDWMYSFNDLYKMFENDFDEFHLSFPDAFIHGVPPAHRIDRLLNLLNSGDNVKFIFFRRGHDEKHCSLFGPFSNEKEIQDIKKLEEIIKKKYPNINYEIVLYLGCRQCVTHADDEITETLKIIYPKYELLPDSKSSYEIFSTAHIDQMKHHFNDSYVLDS